jgi:hypothetical protein
MGDIEFPEISDNSYSSIFLFFLGIANLLKALAFVDSSSSSSIIHQNR